MADILPFKKPEKPDPYYIVRKWVDGRELKLIDVDSLPPHLRQYFSEHGKLPEEIWE